MGRDLGYDVQTDLMAQRRVNAKAMKPMRLF